MTLYVRCKKCGFKARFDELYLASLMELAGAEISPRLKYCNWGTAEDEDELEEHEFEYVEVKE